MKGLSDVIGSRRGIDLTRLLVALPLAEIILG